VAAEAALKIMNHLKELLDLLSEKKGERVIATQSTLEVDPDAGFATETFELVTGTDWVPVTLLHCYDHAVPNQRSYLFTTGKGGRTTDVAERITPNDQPAAWVLCPTHPFF
jgi:hypothetical protein